MCNFGQNIDILTYFKQKKSLNMEKMHLTHSLILTFHVQIDSLGQQRKFEENERKLKMWLNSYLWCACIFRWKGFSLKWCKIGKNALCERNVFFSEFLEILKNFLAFENLCANCPDPINKASKFSTRPAWTKIRKKEKKKSAFSPRTRCKLGKNVNWPISAQWGTLYFYEMSSDFSSTRLD